MGEVDIRSDWYTLRFPTFLDMCMNSEEPQLTNPSGSLKSEERAKNIIKETIGARPLAHIKPGSDLRIEAAALFAANEGREAVKLLIRELNAKAGKVPLPIWYLLLDMYQAQNRQEPYEVLAGNFASHFKISPPAWKPFEESHAQATVGRNVLIVDGPPSVVSDHKIKDVLKASQLLNHCRIDVSRLKMDPQDAYLAEGFKRLVDMMKKIRSFGVPALLMGESEIFSNIMSVIQSGGYRNQEEQSFWWFVLECMQWRGQEEPFEDLAIEFAMAFGLSPPGYEPNSAIALLPSTVTKEESLPYIPPEIFEVFDVPVLMEQIDKDLGEYGQTKINWASVRRMTFEAATHMTHLLNAQSIDASRIVFDEVNEILHALFDMTGVSSLVTLNLVKR